MKPAHLAQALIVTHEPALDGVEHTLQELRRAGLPTTVADNRSTHARALEELTDRAAAAFIPSSLNEGLPAHLNRALRTHPTTEWMLYLDQDTSITAETVVDLVSRAAHHTDRVAVYSPQYRNVASGRLGYSARRLQRRPLTPIGSASLYRTDLCLAVGGFDEGLPLDLCDFDMALRLQTAGHPVVIDPELSVDHAVGRRRDPRRAAAEHHDPWRYYLKAHGLRRVAQRHGLRYPGWAARQVAGRLVEVIRTSRADREPAVLAETARGALHLRSHRVDVSLANALTSAHAPTCR